MAEQMSGRAKPAAAPIEWLTSQRGYWNGYNGIRDKRYEATADEIRQRDAVAVEYLETRWRT